ncbi:hypothetical protein ACRRTK_017629 [Alexandromys fortis]
MAGEKRKNDWSVRLALSILPRANESKLEKMKEYRPKRPANQFVPRLYGFKIHPMAYQLQLQAASNFKSLVKTIR